MGICAMRYACRLMLPPSLKLVLIEISIYARTHPPYLSEISVERICYQTRLSKKTVTEALKTLKDVHFIRDTGKVGRRRWKIYEVLVPSYSQYYTINNEKLLSDGRPDNSKFAEVGNENYR